MQWMILYFNGKSYDSMEKFSDQRNIPLPTKKFIANEKIQLPTKKFRCQQKVSMPTKDINVNEIKYF